MLSWNNFKNVMQFYVTSFPNSQSANIECLKMYYEIMKSDFTDKQFNETSVIITKKARFFPLLADFYQNRQKINIPHVGDLVHYWHEDMKGNEVKDGYGGWLLGVLGFYEGSRLHGNAFREMTEKQWEYMQRDFGKAYNAFCKAYESGTSQRIDFKAIEENNTLHISQDQKKIKERQDQKSLGELLKDYGIDNQKIKKSKVIKSDKKETMKISDIF